MEPFTHALTSLALARAGERRLPRFGTAMLIVSGVIPDLDYASYFAGPSTFLRFHRTALHSLTGAALTACVLGAAFCILDKKLPATKGVQTRSAAPLTYGAAVALCAIGAAGHIVLDLASGVGVQLLWPFRVHWSAWDLVTNLDPWILLMVVAGLLLPLLFRLVNEEVGDRKKGRGVSRAAIITLVLIGAYLGERANLHSKAVDLVVSREMHGRVPLDGGAFPVSFSIFAWRGVAVTDSTDEELDLSLAPGEQFDPNQSVTRYKPEDSPALDIGEKTAAARRFLKYARFPFASVQRIEDGYRVEVHDLRFAPDDRGPSNIFVRVDLNSGLQVREEGFRYAADPNP